MAITIKIRHTYQPPAGRKRKAEPAAGQNVVVQILYRRFHHECEVSPECCLFGDYRVAPHRAEQTLQAENQHPNRETPCRQRTLFPARSDGGERQTEGAGDES